MSSYAHPDEDGVYEVSYTKEEQESHDVQPWRNAGTSPDITPNKPYDKLSTARGNAGYSPDVTSDQPYAELTANRGNVAVSPNLPRDKLKVYEDIPTGGGAGMFSNRFTGNVFKEVTVDSLIEESMEATSPRGNTTGTSSKPTPNNSNDKLASNRGNAGTSCNYSCNEIYEEFNSTKGVDTCCTTTSGRSYMKCCLVMSLVTLMLALAGGNVYLIYKLRNEINELKGLKSHHIEQSRLPAGYADYSVEDLQWQTLHMAAAASCRASGSESAPGAQPGLVIPKNTKYNCSQICSSHDPGLHCEATVHLIGYTGRSNNYTSAVGSYFSTGCGDISSEEELDPRIKVATYHNCVGYCCCRHDKH